jgi:hypothetical protein
VRGSAYQGKLSGGGDIWVGRLKKINSDDGVRKTWKLSLPEEMCRE